MSSLSGADLQTLQEGIEWKLLSYAESSNTDIVPTPPPTVASLCDQADQLTICHCNSEQCPPVATTPSS